MAQMFCWHGVVDCLATGAVVIACSNKHYMSICLCRFLVTVRQPLNSFASCGSVG